MKISFRIEFTRINAKLLAQDERIFRSSISKKFSIRAFLFHFLVVGVAVQLYINLPTRVRIRVHIVLEYVRLLSRNVQQPLTTCILTNGTREL